MSLLQVLRTTKAAFMDSGTGLAARVAAIAEAEELDDVRADFVFRKWALRSVTHPTKDHTVVIRPSAGLDDTLSGQVERDGVHTLAILVEVTASDDTIIEDTLVATQIALLQVLDGLREYSDANDGTIIDIPDPVSTRYGEFTGASALSGGLVATVNIRERSTQ